MKNIESLEQFKGEIRDALISGEFDAEINRVTNNGDNTWFDCMVNFGNISLNIGFSSNGLMLFYSSDIARLGILNVDEEKAIAEKFYNDHRVEYLNAMKEDLGRKLEDVNAKLS